MQSFRCNVDRYSFRASYPLPVILPSPRITENTQKREAVPEEKSNESLSDKLSGFDKDTVKLYSKIPLEGDCSVESLVDSELPIRTVMRGLLKLEMGRFVEMLPGERVRRKS